jgi:hypothetical protein
MTYLELVNKVLVRLREDEVTTVSESAYSKLIGEYVNDALRQVEDAWQWSALRTTITAETEENIFNYVLTNTANCATILNVLNDTSNVFMEYRPQAWFDNVYLNQNPQAGSPRYYTFNAVDINGDTQVDIYPKPDGVYNLRFNVVLRNYELTSDSDVTQVPWHPIVHLATALATRERGESGGNLTPELFLTADRSLSDAIALDAAKHPEETTFYTV